MPRPKRKPLVYMEPPYDVLDARFRGWVVGWLKVKYGGQDNAVQRAVRESEQFVLERTVE